jgi:hypothetical protein
MFPRTRSGRCSITATWCFLVATTIHWARGVDFHRAPPPPRLVEQAHRLRRSRPRDIGAVVDIRQHASRPDSGRARLAPELQSVHPRRRDHRADLTSSESTSSWSWSPKRPCWRRRVRVTSRPSGPRIRAEDPGGPPQQWVVCLFVSRRDATMAAYVADHNLRLPNEGANAFASRRRHTSTINHYRSSDHL